MPLYLTDASIWMRAKESPQVRELLAARLEDDEIATCVPILLEVLSAGTDSDELDMWKHLRFLPVGDREMRRALELLGKSALIWRGGPIAYIIAACAEGAGPDVVLWHHDVDLKFICTSAGICHETELGMTETRIEAGEAAE